MDGKLRCELHLLPHRFPNSSGAEFEAWGILSITFQSTTETRTLLEVEWNLEEFAEWIGENIPYLCRNIRLMVGHDLLPHESLAHAFHRLYDRDFGINDQDNREVDALYEFYTHHNLQCTLIGISLPDIFIGCNQGSGEISLDDEDTTWCYHFRMEDFLTDLQQKLVQFLSTWLTNAPDEHVREYGTNILKLLDKDTKGCCD